MPQIGNATFRIELTEAVGGNFGFIAGSFAPAETPLFGGTLYGDFLTIGQFALWPIFTTGPFGVPGVGTAAVPIQIPNDPTLIGLTTYWQGFTPEIVSPRFIKRSHTGGLAITVVW